MCGAGRTSEGFHTLFALLRFLDRWPSGFILASCLRHLVPEACFRRLNRLPGFRLHRTSCQLSFRWFLMDLRGLFVQSGWFGV